MRIRLLTIPISIAIAVSGDAADYQPARGPLMTRWAQDVRPDNVWPEYPRPQMVRKEWLNLNGMWDYAITSKDAQQPAKWDGKILVPFCIESALSGVMKRVDENQRLWYRRAFRVPSKWKGQRVLLHFGAVDWDATAFVDGRQVGAHRGGYDPFTCDVTDAVGSSAINRASEHELTVSVWDPTDKGTQPCGKQHDKPGGIWYTPVTGIWQTVWMEPVPVVNIEALRIEPDVDRGVAIVTATTRGNVKLAVELEASDAGHTVARATGNRDQAIELKITNAKLWSPTTPHLYDLKVSLTLGGKAFDSVTSYFGMRKIALGKDTNGVTRILLNNQPVFQFGPLDQGWWPDGLYTAPTDEALRYDIEATKRLGMNMARKHVKVEPDRWYYWCDKLGLLVWQDMPNGDKHARWAPDGKHDGTEATRSPESATQFERELRAIIAARRNHPCIVMWVPFNEGWGQFDTVRFTKLVKELDPSRLVNCASGGNDFPVGDVRDIHRYPGPAAPPSEPTRAMVLGEFGGLGLPLRGHTWQDEKNWGYRSFTSAVALTDAYVQLLTNLRPMIASGLSAAIYTQTTDVEVEVNGLMTYDRALVKMDEKRIAAENMKLSARM